MNWLMYSSVFSSLITCHANYYFCEFFISFSPVFTYLKFSPTPPPHTNFIIFNDHHPSKIWHWYNIPPILAHPWTLSLVWIRCPSSAFQYSVIVLIVIVITVSNCKFCCFLIPENTKLWTPQWHYMYILSLY